MTVRRALPPYDHRAPVLGGIALAVTATLLVAPLLAFVPAQAAEADDGLVLHYAFGAHDTSDGTVTDLSPRHLDGTVVHAESASIVDGRSDGEKALQLSGGPASSTTAPYVEIPNGLFKDAHQATISSWVKWDGGADFQWLYGLGKDRDNTAFFTPSFEGDSKARSSIKPAQGRGEVGVSPDGKLPVDQWVNVTTVLTGSSLRLFIDGAFVGSTEAVVDPATTLYDAAKTTSGYLGQPFWTGAHPFFAGAIDDFRVYDRALTSQEVASLAGTTVETPSSLAQTAFDVRTTAGTAPVLPGSVRGTFGDGSQRDVPIDWDAVDPSAYAQTGTFTVAGTAGGVAVTAAVRVARANEMTIDLSSNTGEFMGGASGTLYGLYGEGLPSNNLIEGMNLRTVATKAQDGVQHPGADALEVVKPLVDSSGGDVYIYMTDIYRGFPYQWPGNTLAEKMADYSQKIAVQVDQVLTLPEEYRSHIVFVPFNEPEGNMFGGWLDNPTDFYTSWDTVYRLIKGKMPDARIAGPNTGMLHDGNKGFLQHTADADTVPDVMTWHELNGPNLKRSVETYRGWEDEILGGRHLPINIDEFAWLYHVSVPGMMIQWFSAIEDAKVDADMSYWNIDGNLSDSAVQSNRANGQWWTLNAYSQMTGHTVNVSVPDPDALYTLRGLATLDTDKKQARALFGGATGSSWVSFDNIDPTVFGDSVHALVQRIDWTGTIGESDGPATVKELDLPVTNGSVSFDFGDSLPALTESSVYQIILSPGANTEESSAPTDLWNGSYESEDAALTGAYSIYEQGSPSQLAKFYTSGGKDVGGLKTGSDVTMTHTVDVPEDGVYDLSVFANTSRKAEGLSPVGRTNVFLTVDGADEQELLVPLGYNWEVWDHVDTTVQLTKGQHQLRISGKSLDGSKSTVGDSVFDRITLALPNPAAEPRVYEAENATLKDGAVTRYDQAGAAGSGVVSIPTGGSATFWVHSADEAGSTVMVDTFGGGSGELWINEQNVGSVSASSSHDVFLQGGINKVVVKGTSGTLSLDRLRVKEGDTALAGTAYQAEDAVRGSSSVKVTDYPLADGGTGVSGIGGDQDNTNTLTFDDITVDEAGRYALTFRYSNDEFSAATHYNPDPVARRADVSVNGGEVVPVLFPTTFHADNFFEKTVYVDLEAGKNTIALRSQEALNFDGKTLLSDTFPDAVLRSKWAPNLDRIVITPIANAAVDPEPTPTPTPEPTATPTPTPEPTPEPTSTPTPEPTSQPTSTPVPTTQPTSTPTPGTSSTPGTGGGSASGGSPAGSSSAGSSSTGTQKLATTGTDAGSASALSLMLLAAGAVAFALRRVMRRRPS